MLAIDLDVGDVVLENSGDIDLKNYGVSDDRSHSSTER
jgi:hypothetical protein